MGSLLRTTGMWMAFAIVVGVAAPTRGAAQRASGGQQVVPSGASEGADRDLEEAKRLYDEKRWADASAALQRYRNDYGATYAVEYLLSTAQCETGDVGEMRRGSSLLDQLGDRYQVPADTRGKLTEYARNCDERRWWLEQRNARPTPPVNTPTRGPVQVTRRVEPATRPAATTSSPDQPAATQTLNPQGSSQKILKPPQTPPGEKRIDPPKVVPKVPTASQRTSGTLAETRTTAKQSRSDVRPPAAVEPRRTSRPGSKEPAKP